MSKLLPDEAAPVRWRSAPAHTKQESTRPHQVPPGFSTGEDHVVLRIVQASVAGNKRSIQIDSSKFPAAIKTFASILIQSHTDNGLLPRSPSSPIGSAMSQRTCTHLQTTPKLHRTASKFGTTDSSLLALLCARAPDHNSTSTLYTGHWLNVPAIGTSRDRQLKEAHQSSRTTTAKRST